MQSETIRFRKTLDVLLVLILVFMVSSLWALFVRGPVLLHEDLDRKVETAIQNEIPGIQGLVRNEFAYITWQGYTDEELWWFDVNGNVLTSRNLSTLDYDLARKRARSLYEMEPDEVTLAFGYSHPVYALSSPSAFLLLDYDTLNTVYYRNNYEPSSQ